MPDRTFFRKIQVTRDWFHFDLSSKTEDHLDSKKFFRLNRHRHNGDTSGLKRSRQKSHPKTPRRTSDSRAELLARAKLFRIRGRHRMTKPQLIRALKSHVKKTPTIPRQVKTDQSVTASPGIRLQRKNYDDLPWSYGVTELVLMPVDPFLLYAYWDFASKDWEEIQARRRPVALRIYDITMIQFDGTNAHYYFDVSVSLDAQSWYVHLWSAEKSLCADLGWMLPDGSFQTIVRSNVAQTPRAGVSIFEEVRWVEIRPARRRTAKSIRRRIDGSQKQSQQLAFWKRLKRQAAGLTTGEITGLSSQRLPPMTQPKTPT
jgi:uncharacterized protein